MNHLKNGYGLVTVLLFFAIAFVVGGIDKFAYAENGSFSSKSNIVLRFIPELELRAGLKDGGTLLGKIAILSDDSDTDIAIQFSQNVVEGNSGNKGYIINQDDGSKIYAFILARECWCSINDIGPTGMTGYISSRQGEIVLVTHGRQSVTPGRYQISLAVSVMYS